MNEDLNENFSNLQLENGSAINLSRDILNKQESIQSSNSQEEDLIIDDSKMLECEQNDSDYLNKENLISVLKTYKNILENLKSNKHQIAQQNTNQNFQDLGSFVFNSKNQDQIIQQDYEIDLQIEKINNDLKEIIFTNLKMSESLEDHELPKNIIVAQLPNELFANLDIKSDFERLFLHLDPNCKFLYFRIFKRCLIQFDDAVSAILARFEFDDYSFLNDKLRIFLTKPIRFKNSRPFLEPPKNDKTFLISPPSSPPVGWEQTHEDPPVINYDLLAALSKLNPSEPCELIKSTNSFPGIIVHPCADLSDQTDHHGHRKYIPTKRPAYDF